MQLYSVMALAMVLSPFLFLKQYRTCKYMGNFFILYFVLLALGRGHIPKLGLLFPSLKILVVTLSQKIRYFRWSGP